jgi:protein-tyrosine phosphatase
MASMWDSTMTGVLRLPSGRLVRGRGLARASPDSTTPEFGLYLLGKPPAPMPWDSRWVRWPDFRLPVDRDDSREALGEALRRAERERVEVACNGGLGRTGTALACLAVLDGVPASEAVDYVRARYHARAVETPWQRRYIRDFSNT